MRFSQSIRRHGGAAALALCACGSAAKEPHSAVRTVATVSVAEPDSADAGPRHPHSAAAPEPPRDVPMPSLEVPHGLTENGRDQYTALLATALALIGELNAAEAGVPSDCAPTSAGCADRWNAFYAALAHVHDLLQSAWFDCHGLDAVDAQTFVQTSTQFKAYIIGRVHRDAERLSALFKQRNWVEAERGLNNAVRGFDNVSQPQCR